MPHARGHRRATFRQNLANMGGEIMGEGDIRAGTQHQPVDHPLLRALDLHLFIQMSLDGLASEPIQADDAGAMGQLP